MDWDKLRIFHAVADAGSLTHAGDKLNLSQSAVSRQIRALEEALNATLFHRHARGLILTEQGELLFDATAAMSKRLEAASARIRDSEEEVFGELRVTTTFGFGALWLAPRLPKLYEKYPDLKVDLMLEERVLDLPMREADVAIRMKEAQPGRPDPQKTHDHSHVPVCQPGLSGPRRHAERSVRYRRSPPVSAKTQVQPRLLQAHRWSSI